MVEKTKGKSWKMRKRPMEETSQGRDEFIFEGTVFYSVAHWTYNPTIADLILLNILCVATLDKFFMPQIHFYRSCTPNNCMK